jgi:proteasome lid subunit RPN8/RPN11|tara:strand:+ start:3536 stop:3955 length:420 start_codon:yes stop_codon:yes gene_type:complete
MDLIMEELTRTKTVKQALATIKKLAHQNFKKEICGFLGFDRDKKEYLVQLEKNVAEDPANFFLINPLSFLLFKDDYEMIGVFHSHVKGNEKESEFDVKMSENCCQPFIIYSLNSKKINIYTPKLIEVDVNILNRIKAAS